MSRLWNLPAEVILQGKKGRVLDIASAGAVHATNIASAGFPCVALEPAPTMLAAARQRMAETGVRIQLVQGFAETLPFRDGSFDQVLCHSAIDHFTEPDRCIREMARVLRPDGRLALTFVNYGSISTRLSRLYYRLDGLFRRRPREPHWFWESPVPHEHTFECTVPIVAEMCEQYLTLDLAYGVSIGWQMPGWAWLLDRLDPERADRILERLDAFAVHRATLADVVVLLWRPRPRPSWRMRIPPGPVLNGKDAAPKAKPELLRVTGADPVYQRLIRSESRPKKTLLDTPEFAPILEGYLRMRNRQTTGDPDRSWMHDLQERCRNSGRSAALGIDGAIDLQSWLRAGRKTDVFDLTPKVLEQIRAVVTQTGANGNVRLFQADLSFLCLPANTYDVVWTSGCLHHVVNLEHLLDQIERALTAGGLFAVHDYVGERRRHFSPYRLERMNALLQEIPPRFRRHGVERIEAPHPLDVGPLCSVRSDEIPALLAERFEPVHLRRAGHFYPIEMYLDVQRIEAEEPRWIERLLEAEEAARHDPLHVGCTLYGVYRRKGEAAQSSPK